MESKQLLLTFDYELFLGAKSGTAEKCIINPTNELLNILCSCKYSKAIFFVDTIYLSKLENEKHCENDLALIIAQLVRILKLGHYIFPHLHPHWIDAKYNIENKQWSLNNYSKYRFHNLSECDKFYHFNTSIQIIKNLQKLASIHYPIDSYRAGGFCLQPFEGFKKYFEEFKILNDFSVLKHFKQKTKNELFYDYSNIPNKNIYNFSNNVNIEDKYGSYTEYTISSILQTHTFFTRIFDKYFWVFKNKKYGAGKSIDISTLELRKQNLPQKIFTKTIKRQMVSIELLTNYNIKNHLYTFSKTNYLHFISHPKMFTPHNLKVFSKFLSKVTAQYNIETDYKKMAINKPEYV